MENYIDHQFTKKDIDELISTSAEESINLEFKQGAALSNSDPSKDEIAKDVSSFANSDGGIIIYGIEEENHKASKLSFVDGSKITKEWLELVISSRIQQKISDIRIDVIRYEKKIEKSVFVVRTPRSLNAPHISKGNKYYKRYNFVSTPMEEYEVRDMYTRQGRTILKILAPKVTVDFGMISPVFYINATLDFYIKNKGQSIEKLYKFEVHVPTNLGIDHNQSVHKYLNRREGLYTIYSIPNSSPLFQNEVLLIESLLLKISPHNIDISYNMEFKTKLFYSNGTEEFTFFLLDKSTFSAFDKPKRLSVIGQSMTLLDWVD